MTIISILIGCLVNAVLLTYFLWVFYLAVMNLVRAKEAGKLSRTAFVLGTPILLTGVILDVLCNIFVATFLVLELPRELLVTTRLKRLVKTEGWRSKVAKFICSRLLDQFDPSGCHCD